MKKKRKSGSNEGNGAESPSRLIDARIQELDDWRGEMLARVRNLIQQADPEVVEEVKWRKPSNAMRGVPVWSHAGILCTGETYKKVVKLTFAKGAALEDPSGLFNSSLEGNTRRAIDFHEGDKIDEKALQALIRAAVALNTSSAAERLGAKAKVGANTTDGKTSKKSATAAKKSVTQKPVAKKAAAQRGAAKPKLLSGGNPQIAKADGDAPVQAYIAAMPGWKSDVGRRLDALIVRTVPHVRKAVRWNSPFYGIEGQGWFLSFHCFTKYIKATFLNGTSLRPLPPVESKDRNTRYFHIHENDQLDEEFLTSWIQQASELPGENCF